MDIDEKRSSYTRHRTDKNQKSMFCLLFANWESCIHYRKFTLECCSKQPQPIDDGIFRVNIIYIYFFRIRFEWTLNHSYTISGEKVNKLYGGKERNFFVFFFYVCSAERSMINTGKKIR